MSVCFAFWEVCGKFGRVAAAVRSGWLVLLGKWEFGRVVVVGG